MVTMRLLWMLDTVPGLREAAQRSEVMFGCVDSWILYKLTGQHITEGKSNAQMTFLSSFLFLGLMFLFAFTFNDKPKL